LGIVLGSLLAMSSQAEDKPIKPLVDDRDSGVHTLTIIQGPNRTVHYFTKSESPSERAALRDLERAENEANYADSLLALRQQYVTNERLMENRRNLVQMAQYGMSSESTSRTHYSATDTAVGQPGNSGVLTALPGSGFSSGFPFNGTGTNGFFPTTTTTGPGFTPTTAGFGLPFPNTGFTANGGGLTVPATGFTATGAGVRLPFGTTGTGGTGFGFPGFGGLSGFGGSFSTNSFASDAPVTTETRSNTSSTRVTRSLADGVGDEGKFKNEMVAMIAKQATPEYAAQAQRNYMTAATNAIAALNPPVKNPNRLVGWDKQKPRRVKVTLKGGEAVVGALLREDGQWITIMTDKDEQRIRAEEVTRMSFELPGK